MERPPLRFALGCGLMPLDAAVRAAAEAEAAGYEAVWVGENGLDLDAFVTAAAVLARTSRIRVGPGVASALERHPMTLARAAAALDRLGGGRAQLGIGRGDPAQAAAQLGVDPAGAGAALADAARICAALLRGGRSDHDGRRWSAHLGPFPARTAPLGHVPLAVAAVGPRGLRLAGEVADIALLNYCAPPEYVAWAVEQVRQGEREAGRTAGSVAIHGYVLLARTDLPGAEPRVEVVRRTVAATLTLPDQGEALAAPAGGVPSSWDGAALARFAVVGDARACARRLAEYHQAGLECAVLLPAGMRDLHLSGR